MFIKYDRHQSLDSFLNGVHQEMKMKYAIQQKASNDKIDAQKIENFLRLFKKAAKNPKSEIEEGLNEEVQEILDMALKNQSKMRKRKLTSTKQFFHRSHTNTKTSKGFDDIFEEEFAALMQAFLDKTMGQGSAIKVMAHEEINTPLFEMFNAGSSSSREFMNHYQEKVKKIVKENAVDTRNEMFTGVEFKSGKTDIRIEGFNIEGVVSTNLRPEWQEVIPLLQNANFSLKNYSSSEWTGPKGHQTLITELGGDIHLGNTNVYKAITSALISLGVNFEDTQSVFYRGYWGTVKYGRQHSHLYHLRFLYELSGAGAITKDGKAATNVNYLIFNDPMSDNIYVKSVAELISDMLENSQGSGLFSNVKISKKKFYSSNKS